MALKTLKVRDIRKLFDGLPDDQDVLLIDADGTAAEIREIDPLTITDDATGAKVLTIEFSTDPDRWFGFDQKTGNIDSND